MDKITIYSADRLQSVEMPVTRQVTMGGEEVADETQMISGKMVKDVRGFRATFTYEWEWVPADKMTMLHTILRQGGYFYVEYPDIVNGASNGIFSISYPESKIFKFVNGDPMWYGVALTFTSQGVV